MQPSDFQGGRQWRQAKQRTKLRMIPQIKWRVCTFKSANSLALLIGLIVGFNQIRCQSYFTPVKPQGQPASHQRAAPSSSLRAALIDGLSSGHNHEQQRPNLLHLESPQAAATNPLLGQSPPVPQAAGQQPFQVYSSTLLNRNQQAARGGGLAGSASLPLGGNLVEEPILAEHRASSKPAAAPDQFVASTSQMISKFTHNHNHKRDSGTYDSFAYPAQVLNQQLAPSTAAQLVAAAAAAPTATGPGFAGGGGGGGGGGDGLKESAQNQRNHHHEGEGKFLICYYANKQTAPHLQRDSREFVVPLDQLDRMASEFMKTNSGLHYNNGDKRDRQQHRFSAPAEQQQQSALVAHSNGNRSPIQSGSPSASLEQVQQQLAASSARALAVTPKFVPTNQSISALAQDLRNLAGFDGLNGLSKLNSLNIERRPNNDRIFFDKSDSLAQIFFTPSANRRKTIASRQDNGSAAGGGSSQPATVPATSANKLLANRPRLDPTRFLTPQLAADLVISNNDEVGGGGARIVFDQNNKSKHDFSAGTSKNRDLTGALLSPAAIVIGRMSSSAGDLSLPPQPLSTFSSPIVFPLNSKASLSIDQRAAPKLDANNRLDYSSQGSAALNLDQQQLLRSSSMSKTFIGGGATSSSAPLSPSTSSAPVSTAPAMQPHQPPATQSPTSSVSANNNDNQRLDSASLSAPQTGPLLQSDNSNYYYYYNLPNNQPVASATVFASSNAGASQTAPVTPSLTSTGASYRPASLNQQQYELASSTLQNINIVGSAGQKGKSLQLAETDLTGPLPSMTLNQVGAPAPAPAPTYLIGRGSFGSSGDGNSGAAGTGASSAGVGLHNRPVERLIFVNSPSSPATLTEQRQQYSGMHLNSPEPASITASDMLKSLSAATNDVGLITGDGSGRSGKTTPIASPTTSLLPTSSSQLSTAAGASASSLPITTFATARPSSSSTAPSMLVATQINKLSTKADEPTTSINRNQHLHSNTNANHKQNIGIGGNSLSAALVSSPLSTMFDVFGAASQYLMRFKPSSLISPSSFVSLGSASSDQGSTSGHQKSRLNASSPSGLSIFSSRPTNLQSFSEGLAGAAPAGGGKTTPNDSRNLPSSNNSSAPSSGFLPRFSLQSNQRREDICGRTIQIPERRIIGGEGARYGEFPYQVHIKIAKHQCGGALIDKQSIVTAAHCVYHFITRAPVSKLQIVIGAYDIEDEQYQELPPQYFKVNRVKLHPNFRFSASHPDRYDIAILRLDKPVKYADNVMPVCLPARNLKYENMVGTVTGFGKTDPSLSNRYGTRLLQKVDVPIIENGECERWHRTRGIDLKIFPEMMCAGYEDGLKDACVGDSGGPLVVKTPVGSNGSFRWTLAGITSAGFGCAQSRQPGIYHRVSQTVDWILENLD